MNYENRLKEIDGLKKEIDRHRPLSQKALEQLKGYYRIGLTYSSNALEGNSLTETETKIVIEEGITVGGKPLRDHYEAMGHSEAFSLLFELAQKKTITEKNILSLHRLFYYRMDEIRAGTYRKEKVILTGSSFIPPHPSKIAGLMKKFVAVMQKYRKKLHPVEFAAWLHKELVTIHPFTDGNGRTARLLMNLALLQTGYAVTIIPPVVRSEYINALQKAQTGAKDSRPFLHFIAGMVYESMKDYKRLLNAL